MIFFQWKVRNGIKTRPKDIAQPITGRGQRLAGRTAGWRLLLRVHLEVVGLWKQECAKHALRMRGPPLDAGAASGDAVGLLPCKQSRTQLALAGQVASNSAPLGFCLSMPVE